MTIWTVMTASQASELPVGMWAAGAQSRFGCFLMGFTSLFLMGFTPLPLKGCTTLLSRSGGDNVVDTVGMRLKFESTARSTATCSTLSGMSAQGAREFLLTWIRTRVPTRKAVRDQFPQRYGSSHRS